MKTLTSFVKESKLHIRNIYYDNIFEELDNIDSRGHGGRRKTGKDDVNYSPSTNIGGITNKVIKKIFEKIDYIILEGCHLNKFNYLSNSDDPSQIGIVDVDKNESIMIICFIDNYRKSDDKYDIKLKTVGRRNYEQKVKDVKLEIVIKGKYKKVNWH